MSGNKHLIVEAQVIEVKSWREDLFPGCEIVRPETGKASIC